jgi:hypothetical protein
MKRNARFDRLNNFYIKANERIRKQPEIAILLIIITVLLWPLASNMVASRIDSWVTILFLAAAIGAVGVLIIRLVNKGPEGQLPADLKLGDYVQRCVNTREFIQEANEISRKVFGDATIDGSAVQAILVKNKQACLGLFEKTPEGTEKLVGYASCWPIRKEVYERLRLGESDPSGISEAEITAGDVLSDMEIDQAEVLFVPGIAVLDRHTFKGRERAAVLTCAFLHHVRTTYRPAIQQGRPVKLFIVGFTSEGQKLTAKMVGHLGLNTPTGYITLYGERVPFYETNIYPADWDTVVEKVEGALFRALFLPPGAQ